MPPRYTPTHLVDGGTVIALNVSPFASSGCFFRYENGPGFTRPSRSIESDVIGLGTRDVRAQLEGSIWEMHCPLVDSVQATIDSLFKVFSEDRGLIYLRADDGAGVNWRVQCRIMRLEPREGAPAHWIAVLRVPDPTWEENASTAISQLGLSGDASVPFTLTNNGNRRSYPVIEIKGSQKIEDPTENFGRFFVGHIANRSELFWNDLPILLRTFNHAAEVRDTTKGDLINKVGGIGAGDNVIDIDTPTGGGLPAGPFFAWIDAEGGNAVEQIAYTARTGTQLTGVTRGHGGTVAGAHGDNAQIFTSHSRADGVDIRVFLDGAEVDRFVVSANSTATKVWINTSMAPRVKLTPATSITAGNPGNGASLALVEGVAALPESGLLGQPATGELFSYSSRDIVAKKIKDIQRGVWHSPVAAGGTNPMYLVERIFVIAWGKSDTGLEPAPLERRPVIDLINSDNSQWRWIGGALTPFYEPARPSRPAAWLPSYVIPEGDQHKARGLRLEGTAITVEWADADPTHGKPLVPRLVLRLPQGVEQIAGAITYDVFTRRDHRARILGRDFKGFEVELADHNDIGEATLLARTITPGDELYEIILNAVRASVAGNNDTDSEIGLTGATWLMQKVVLDQDTEITGIHLRLKKGTGTEVFQGRVTLWDDSGGSTPELGRIVGWFNRMDDVDPMSDTVNDFNQGDLSTSYAVYEFIRRKASARATARLRAGTYWIRVELISYTSGTFFVDASTISETKHDLVRSALGWGYPGTAHRVLWFRILHAHGGPVQEEMGLFQTGLSVAFDTITIQLDDNVLDPKTPYVVGATSTQTYHCIGVLTNTTNGKSITFGAFLHDLSVKSSLEIDTRKKLITLKQGQWRQPWASLVILSDVDAWLPLEPGANSMTYDETNRNAVDITGSYRGAKV